MNHFIQSLQRIQTHNFDNKAENEKNKSLYMSYIQNTSKSSSAVYTKSSKFDRNHLVMDLSHRVVHNLVISTLIIYGIVMGDLCQANNMCLRPKLPILVVIDDLNIMIVFFKITGGWF